MMFLLDLAFAAELIALGLGVAFLVWAYRNDGAGVAATKVFGYIITIAAGLALLCTTYYGSVYWAQGYFKSPIAPMLMMKHHKGMMKDNPMMMQQKQQSTPRKQEQHEG